jgi:hypothetical protein
MKAKISNLAAQVLVAGDLSNDSNWSIDDNWTFAGEIIYDLSSPTSDPEYQVGPGLWLIREDDGFYVTNVEP